MAHDAEGEAVERVRAARELHYADCDRLRIYDYGDRTGDCHCTATVDAQALLAAVSRLTAERDEWERRAVEQFDRAVEGRVDAGSVVQWGVVSASDGVVAYVFEADEEDVAREIASRRGSLDRGLLRTRTVGPWRDAE